LLIFERKEKIMSEQENLQSSTLQYPITNDLEEWKAYWKAQGQPWRTEAEIERERQDKLKMCLAIVSDIKKGIYPFRGMALSRADVEWLISTHESGHKPEDWNDKNQQPTEGLDLRGADLRHQDLSNLPLARLRGGLTLSQWFTATVEQRKMAGVFMEGAKLSSTHLEEADLSGAQMNKADLREAKLGGARLHEAQLEGADLRGAQLKRADLRGAQLKRADLRGAQLKRADLDWAELEKANISNAELLRTSLIGAQFTGTSLIGAQLEGANLYKAQLEKANLYRAQLKGADISEAQLEGVNFGRAQLEGVNFGRAQLEGVNFSRARLEGVNFEGAKLSDKNRVGPRLADAQLGNTNLAIVDWSQVKKLGDELQACQKKEISGENKDKATRLNEYKAAVRANRQLAVALQAQGLNEEAARFAYRAQKLQRAVLLRQLKVGQYLFSGFLALLAGYGYKPVRGVIAYVLVILVCASVYYAIGQTLGPSLTPLGAIVFSITSFHGRGFFPGPPTPGTANTIPLDHPMIVLAACEAIVGLLIELSFIATFTQRFFGK
jgi:uncharacterized protein YjbI with pentapeptide repeats